MKPLKWLWKQINRFNFWFMSGLADKNATAWTFYILVFAIVKVWTISPPHTPLEWLQQIISVLYQGAALPLLAFISKREGSVIMQYLKETFDHVITLLTLIGEVMKIIHENAEMDRENAERDREIRAEILQLAKETHEMHRQMKCTICDGQPGVGL